MQEFQVKNGIVVFSDGYIQKKLSEKKGFILFNDVVQDACEDLDDEQLGVLLRESSRLATDQSSETMIDDRMICMYLRRIKRGLEKNNRDYLETCARNVLNTWKRMHKDIETDIILYDGKPITLEDYEKLMDSATSGKELLYMVTSGNNRTSVVTDTETDTDTDTGTPVVTDTDTETETDTETDTDTDNVAVPTYNRFITYCTESVGIERQDAENLFRTFEGMDWLDAEGHSINWKLQVFKDSPNEVKA